MSSWHSLKAANDAQSELIASEQEKVSSILLLHSRLCVSVQYRELCKAIGSLTGSESTDIVELLHSLEQVVQVWLQYTLQAENSVCTGWTGGERKAGGKRGRGRGEREGPGFSPDTAHTDRGGVGEGERESETARGGAGNPECRERRSGERHRERESVLPEALQSPQAGLYHSSGSDWRLCSRCYPSQSRTDSKTRGRAHTPQVYSVF